MEKGGEGEKSIEADMSLSISTWESKMMERPLVLWWLWWLGPMVVAVVVVLLVVLVLVPFWSF